MTDVLALKKIIIDIKKAGQFCLDLETTSLEAVSAKIVGVALSFGAGTACYVPVAHQSAETQIPLAEALEVLKELLHDPELVLIGHNLKYELMVFKNYNIPINCQLEDTLIQSYLLDSDAHRHSLDVLAAQHLQYTMLSFKEVTGGKTFDTVSLKKATQYAAEDADITWQLHQILRPKLIENNLAELYQQIEIPLLEVLATIERHGVKIDAEYLKTIEQDTQIELKELEQQIYGLAGEEFNVESPLQLQKILFEKLKLKTFKKTKKGFSTDASVLLKLAPLHPIAPILLKHRVKSKLNNTYLTVLPKMMNSQTGRIHTSYNQSIAATGRLSSQNPNLQNIPIGEAEGASIRSGFVPERGAVLLSVDYSQIELRILAHLSEDPILIQAFKQDADIHTETAVALFNVPYAEISADMRRTAKTINFGILYGMGAVRLAEAIGTDRAEAKQFIDAYFNRFVGIQAYMEQTLHFAREHGYVETMFARRRRVDAIRSANKHMQAAAERIAINSRIQGSAADIIKKSMIDIHQFFTQEGIAAKMIMQVHDELVFEVAAEQLSDIKKIVVDKMENATPLLVPLKVSAGVGKNWQNAHS